MAGLFCDGFDTVTTVANAKAKYATTTGGALTTGRTGINAYRLTTAGSFLTTRVLPTSGSTAIVGCAFRLGAGTPGNTQVLTILEGATVHMQVYVDASFHLQVRRNTTLLATSSAVLAANTWYYLEFKVAISDTVGTYEVRIDGTTFGGLIATGQDTRNAGTGVWDTVSLFGNLSVTVDYDDLYICDGSGAANNDFLGDSKVDTLLPQTDAVAAGANANFTPSTGTDHGALVDEADPNGDTDYNSSSTVGHIDTHNYPSMALSGTIRWVQPSPYLEKTDAGVRTVSTVTRVGGTNYVNGTAFTPATSYQYNPQVFETNPNSGVAWLATDVNGAEFGLKIIS